MDNVISNEQKRVLYELAMCFEKHKLDYALIGAMALQIQHVDLGRFTRDLDFSILVKVNYEDFLEKCGLKRTSIPHRFEFKDAIVDIIPVIEGSKSSSIYWQTGELMDILGYREAIKNATGIKIEAEIGTITLRVAPVPIVIFLKLVACKDRVESGDYDHAVKHLKDALNSLEQYEIKGERRFDYVEEVQENENQFECAGAFLAGHDLRSVSSEEIVSSFSSYVKLCSSLRIKDYEKMLLKCFNHGFNYGGQ